MTTPTKYSCHGNGYIHSTSDERQPRHNNGIVMEGSPNEKKASKKCKVKEASYFAVVGKVRVCV